MKTLLFYLSILNCFLFGYGLLSAGPIGKVKLYKLQGCSKSQNVTIKWVSKDDTAYKVDMFFVLPKEITAAEKIKYVVDKWEGGKWQKGAFVYEYKFCDLIFKVMKNGYNRAKALSSPKLPNKCPIPKNGYTVNGVDFLLKEIGLPVVPYGKFYFKITMGGICLDGEMDSLRNF